MAKLAWSLVLLGMLGAAAVAEAQPMPPGFYGGPPGFAPYYHPFRRFGPYGTRRFPPRLSYGTGYHGPGTATGGPVGGLPNRN